MAILHIIKRDSRIKPDDVRADYKIPGVYYGRTEESTLITIDRGDFERMWHEAGESTIITLEDEDGETVDTLIHDVQIDPVTEAPIHIDFFAFERGKPIEVNVPIEFIGEAPAVRELGGILVKVVHDLAISTLPKNLPQHIEVDISSLIDFDSQIIAKDITLPEGVDLAVGEEEVIASVDQPSEEPEEPEEEMSIDDIEVEGEKTAEDDEADEGTEDGEQSEQSEK